MYQPEIHHPSGNLPLDSLFQRLMVIGKDPALAAHSNPLKKRERKHLGSLGHLENMGGTHLT